MSSSYEAHQRQRCFDLNASRDHHMDLARSAYEMRRRSAVDTATAVSDFMVSRAAQEFPDVFAGRDLEPLKALIRQWILSGSGE